MFKIEKGKSKILLAIANELYSKLNPVKKKTGSLQKNSLKKRLLKKIRSEKDIQKKIFYRLLSEHRFKLLREIITGDPTQLQLIHNRIEAMVAANTIPPFSQSVRGVLSSTEFGNEILKLFDYKSCRGSIKFIWLVDELDVVVCPYCNDCHTHKVKTTDDEKILYEFDHFIPKVIAPYLSLSFFNLIPACHVCNSNLKGTTIFNLNEYAHPYNDDLHSWVNFSIDRPVDINDENSFDIEIKTKTTVPDEILKSGNNINLFAIQQRYNNFKDDIIRLERKRHQYTEDVKNDLLNEGIFGFVFKDRSELNAYIADELDIPVSEFKAMRKEKGKFKMDIAKEFKIID
ncbi:hypothetical protein [Larkinella terrae]|uniref:HNH endonuclease n=1 Tax=Larkinella terrae TaxID=2025311 RepID=A0A7K0ED20_9BACT|nr:hypothetical protein [Larkinella terrae]MRS59797.1 hypothetical protein [Larkinella terrae]